MSSCSAFCVIPNKEKENKRKNTCGSVACSMHITDIIVILIQVIEQLVCPSVFMVEYSSLGESLNVSL